MYFLNLRGVNVMKAKASGCANTRSAHSIIRIPEAICSAGFRRSRIFVIQGLSLKRSCLQPIRRVPRLNSDSTKLKTLELSFKPFTPKTDQFQISPAASPAISHHTVMKNLAFHSLHR